MSLPESIFARGLAIGGVDIVAGTHLFEFRGERYALKSLALNEERPNRMVRTFRLPELRYGFVARIEEVRQAAALEAECA